MERSRRSLKGKEEESLGFVISGYLIVSSIASVSRGDILGQNSLICWLVVTILKLCFFLNNSTLGMILLVCL